MNPNGVHGAGDDGGIAHRVPVALSVAGSDCSAGAGIQADLKTFSAFGVYGLTALTCVVSETSRVVRGVHAVPSDLVADQVSLMLAAFPVAAVKTGMLFSAQHVEAVLAALEASEGPLVVDPVMVASTGDPLIEQDAVDLYRQRLAPRATLITPNLDEAAVLLEEPVVRDEAALEGVARRLRERYRCAVLLKGGHLRGERAVDLLVLADGSVHRHEAPFLRGFSTHGTGCTYSAAVAAGLACGWDLPTSVARAKEFVTEAIRTSLKWMGAGGEIDAMNHALSDDDRDPPVAR